MTNESDRFWDRMVKPLQDPARLPPSTQAEAEQDFDAADQLPLSKDLTEAITARVMGASQDADLHQPTIRLVPDASCDSAERAQRGAPQDPLQRRTWGQAMKTVMNKRWSQYAAAAAIVMAVLVGYSLLPTGQGVSQAYAFDQTVQAMHSVRSFHLQCEPTAGGHVGEIWAEFDQAGEVIRCRMDFPDTDDGPKITLWHDDKAEIWFQKKKSFVTLADKSVAEFMMDMAFARDPKLMVSHLQDQQTRGLVRIETQAPTAASQPIVLTATYLHAGRDSRRYVLTIDPATRMVQQIEAYVLVKGQYQFADRTRIVDYNRLIDSAIFSPELPEDTIIVDQTRQDVGLAQGDMTREQAVMEVARQFFQALIGNDYAVAGQMASGLSAESLQKQLGPIRVLQIAAIGQPTLADVSLTYHVTCAVQVEEDGKVHDKSWTLSIRPVWGHMDRWAISGGL